MVEDKNICELTNEQFAYILALIDRKYDDDNFNHYDFKQIIINEIEEVKGDYLKAVKKSIIDYILLDKTERDRLNVNYIPHSLPFYG